jgi:hypothetical protein
LSEERSRKREAKPLTSKRLAQWRARGGAFDELWEKELRSARHRLTLAERLRFHALHLQFHGASMPGFGRAVQAARFVALRLRRRRP